MIISPFSSVSSRFTYLLIWLVAVALLVRWLNAPLYQPKSLLSLINSWSMNRKNLYRLSAASVPARNASHSAS